MPGKPSTALQVAAGSVQGVEHRSRHGSPVCAGTRQPTLMEDEVGMKDGWRAAGSAPAGVGVSSRGVSSSAASAVGPLVCTDVAPGTDPPAGTEPVGTDGCGRLEAVGADVIGRPEAVGAVVIGSGSAMGADVIGRDASVGADVIGITTVGVRVGRPREQAAWALAAPLPIVDVEVDVLQPGFVGFPSRSGDGVATPAGQ